MSFIQPIKLAEEGVVFLSTSMLEVLQHPTQGAKRGTSPQLDRSYQVGP
jgi:hypothetical protein